MKIGLDAMGGYYAPDTIIEGAVDAFPNLSSSDELFLIGDENLILSKLNEMGVDPSRFVIVHASQTIGMGETPSRAFAQKPDSIDEFATILDRSLQAINSDYEAKRHKDITLQPLQIVEARPGLFDDWLKSKGKLGGQHKIPRLSNSRDYIEELLKMNE